MDLYNMTIQRNVSNETVENPAHCDDHCRRVLATLYSIVLLGGTASTIMMSHVLLQRNSQSIITVIIANIIVLHSILLLSLPFRLSYYFLLEWKFGWFICRVISSTVHFHMYFTFVFYVAIIVIRLLIYFKRFPLQELQKCHVIALSVAIWLVGMLIFSLIFLFQYGTHMDSSQHHCFQFYQELNHTPVIVINYCMIGIIMVTVLILSLIQLVVITQLTKTLWPEMLTHQEFRAHINSFFFLVVIIVCFLPHHTFRVFFIQNYFQNKKPELILCGEICKALTTVCCLDMLCFISGLAH
ncbi:probable G-protein coupled receptor 141 [Vombatus ursinus]|uniref:G-protein coupled receptors family 1 profile domain-containing protein n=1 Tax=Vombatus ursinus TaxID=29139 RepID=A0A4X2KZ87_VOMUR|nr:probable G-protein coupled receptor 141 [Vombatus ursinus]XP_027691677.1 probable G-protein coupled receptor 141 [Vombatus ursinus]XP_027691678.1 probable G-protein coupled receptor 141 [Vombatus ursinus]XP_027691679.1 probable G-protein coupled receptor 141 [Vombatus ursinus]XP_027691680.1 probable G-protein coupled receptor 141 [Vombatus ursinus]XP_027691681.1 probable G-protein coupled receptor 141 [Vombatus ursinus]